MSQIENNPSYEEVLWIQKKEDKSIYWINKPKLISQIEVEWESWGVEWKAYTLWIQINAADYSIWEVVSFEGFWFKPKKVMIQWNWTVWLWYFDYLWEKSDSTTTLSSESGHLIYLENWAALFSAFLLDFTDDWFRITVSNKTNDSFFFYATCFSNI